MHICGGNNHVNDHNGNMLSNLKDPLFTIHAMDIVPKNVLASTLNKVLSRSQMETWGLARVFEVKVKAKIMLTCNIDILDKLRNGPIGTVFHIKVDNNHRVSKIYVKFDDETAGLKKDGIRYFRKKQ